MQSVRPTIKQSVPFNDATGLDPAGDLRFDGISVDRGARPATYVQDPSQILATLKIAEATPALSDTVVQALVEDVPGLSAEATAQISRFSPRLDGPSDAFETLLSNVDATLASARLAIDTANSALT